MTLNANPISYLYHGHQNSALPYSLVVRHGTFGLIRERTEEMLRQHVKEPFKTKALALDSKRRLNPGLSLFVDVYKYED